VRAVIVGHSRSNPLCRSQWSSDALQSRCRHNDVIVASLSAVRNLLGAAASKPNLAKLGTGTRQRTESPLGVIQRSSCSHTQRCKRLQLAKRDPRQDCLGRRRSGISTLVRQLIEPKVHAHAHVLSIVVNFSSHRAGVPGISVSDGRAIFPKVVTQVLGLEHQPARERNLIADANGPAERSCDRGAGDVAQRIAAGTA